MLVWMEDATGSFEEDLRSVTSRIIHRSPRCRGPAKKTGRRDVASKIRNGRGRKGKSRRDKIRYNGTTSGVDGSGSGGAIASASLAELHSCELSRPAITPIGVQVWAGRGVRQAWIYGHHRRSAE
jgi:hypothetical protein